jgi:pilus assembly protein CpaD
MRTDARAASCRTLAVAALGAILISGCDDHRRLDDATAVRISNAEERHPIQFASRREAIDIEVPPGAEGLSPNQHTDVYRYLQRYRHEAKGRLTVTAPAAARDRAAIARSLQGIQRHLVEAGVDYRLVRGTLPDARSGEVPAIRLSYQRPMAIAPQCDHWQENVGRNEERIPYPNWGCATQRNLAVMVDNARDLAVPQPEDQRSGERRSATWSAYTGTSSTAGDSSADAGKKATPGTTKK